MDVCIECTGNEEHSYRLTNHDEFTMQSMLVTLSIGLGTEDITDIMSLWDISSSKHYGNFHFKNR